MTDTLIERVAKSDAEFDGRTWLGMPAAERKRYLARAEKSVAICAAACMAWAQGSVDPDNGDWGDYRVDSCGLPWKANSEYGRARCDAAHEINYQATSAKATA